MKTMYKKRLLKLAAMLEEDAKNKDGLRFNLQYIAIPRDSREGWKPGVDCGTVGCAIGLAALSGRFKRAGLYYKLNGRLLYLVDPGDTSLLGGYDLFAARVFGISLQEAHHLFNPINYIETDRTGSYGEYCVAARIRKLVAGKTKKKCAQKNSKNGSEN